MLVPFESVIECQNACLRYSEKEGTNNATNIGSKCDSLLARKGKIHLEIFLQGSVGIIHTNVVYYYSKQPLYPLNLKSRHHDTGIP